MTPVDNMQAKADDDDDQTVTSGSKTTENGPGQVELMVRFQLPSRANAGQAKSLQYDVLVALLKSFPNEVIYIDNKQEEYGYNNSIADEPFLQQLTKTTMTAHEVRAQKNQSTGNRWIIVLKFRSTIPGNARIPRFRTCVRGYWTPSTMRHRCRELPPKKPKKNQTVFRSTPDRD